MANRSQIVYARLLRFLYIRMPFSYPVTRALYRLLPPPRPARVNIQGTWFTLDVRDLLQANILLDGHWASNIEAWLLHIARRSKVIMDVGAHIGFYSMLACREAGPQACVHAFEPNPRMFAQLEQNKELNGFQNAVLNRVAVSDAAGTLTLRIRDMFEPGASGQAVAIYDQEIDVPAVTLDAYCDQHGLDRVDLLKIDIEGAELAALRGMAGGLREGRYKVLIIDIHHHVLGAAGLDAVLNLLQSAGYRVFNIAGQTGSPVADPAALGEEIVAVQPESLQAYGITGDGAGIRLTDGAA